tara:strand:+ start:1027 stop:1404 length:378 start_codon:yes stop_codon:yes gene_type:complete
MRKYLGLLFLGLFLSGCYSNSLTMVGPVTGVASGKISETAASTSFNYLVKKQTGKTPIEHVLSENQIKTLETNKAKLNPCEKNKDFCSIINKRVKNTRKQLLSLNLQARIEKQHNKILLNKSKKD